VGSVATGGVADGDKHETGLRHFGEYAIVDDLLTELRRVDEVVGGVDPEGWGDDRREFWLRVVVARGVDVVDEIVGVDVGNGPRHIVVDVFLRLRARGLMLLHLQRCGAHDEEHGFCSAYAFYGRCCVFAVLPGGIILDALDGDVAGHAIAACEFNGIAGEGCESVHKLGVGLSPHPGLHAAH
jgi:hypothetical protein